MFWALVYHQNQRRRVLLDVQIVLTALDLQSLLNSLLVSLWLFLSLIQYIGLLMQEVTVCFKPKAESAGLCWAC